MSLPYVSGFTVFTAQWFPYLLIGIAVVYEFFMRDNGGTFRSLVRVFSPSAVALIIVEVIKFLYHTPRPFLALNITPLVSVSDPLGSFPSMHTTIFFALGMSMFFCNRKLGKWFLFSALLIGIARIGAGVHWPVDIFGGALLGLVVAAVVERLLPLIWKDHVPAC